MHDDIVGVIAVTASFTNQYPIYMVILTTVHGDGCLHFQNLILPGHIRTMPRCHKFIVVSIQLSLLQHLNQYGRHILHYLSILVIIIYLLMFFFCSENHIKDIHSRFSKEIKLCLQGLPKQTLESCMALGQRTGVVYPMLFLSQIVNTGRLLWPQNPWANARGYYLP